MLLVQAALEAAMLHAEDVEDGLVLSLSAGSQ